MLTYLIIFPEFVFAFIVGAMGWWLERKLTARFQYRVGPPWYQSFIDIAKLFTKETLMPRNASKWLFILSPIIAFSSTTIFSLAILQSYFMHNSFTIDVIVLLYLLIVPSLCIIIGSFASNNPLALVGATREIKLMLAYEFVFIVSLVIIIIKSGGSIKLNGIIAAQQATHAHIASLSGIIASILGLFYLQAKLGIVPFDAAEAEQEIMGGTMIEYSGSLLGFFRATKLLLYGSLPLLLILLFGQFPHSRAWQKFLTIPAEYIIIILLVAVIKNINPRLRIKEILNFFWFFLFPVGIVGIILALRGM
ncbi:MAG: complex I subunit 1 family protein [Candidatus Omnitrophota bacterium]